MLELVFSVKIQDPLGVPDCLLYNIVLKTQFPMTVGDSSIQLGLGLGSGWGGAGHCSNDRLHVCDNSLMNM